MRFRVFAATFLAVLCGSALYAQIPERVTFQPATFGHATHYGFHDAGVGSSGKMTYASTNRVARNNFGRASVVRPYGMEPTQIIGYSQPEYRVRGYRPQRTGCFYTPVYTDDCLCGGGGMIETPKVVSPTKPSVEAKDILKEKPIPHPISKPIPPDANMVLPFEKPSLPVIKQQETLIVPPPQIPPSLSFPEEPKIELTLPEVKRPSILESLPERETVTTEDAKGLQDFESLVPSFPSSSVDADDVAVEDIFSVDEDDSDPFGGMAPVPADDKDDFSDAPFADMVPVEADDKDDFSDDPFADMVPVPADDKDVDTADEDGRFNFDFPEEDEEDPFGGNDRDADFEDDPF